MNYLLYLRVYLQLLKTNVIQQLTHRANLYAGILATLSWVGLSVVTMVIYSYQTPSVGGWNRQELFMLVGVFSVITGVTYTLFLPNFQNITEMVNDGTFDFVLLRPLDSQYVATTKVISLQNVSRIIVGITLIIIAGTHQRITSTNVIMSLILIFAAIIALYSLWMLFMTLNFYSQHLWNISVFLLNLFGQLERTPGDMIKAASVWAFTFLLPMLVIVNTPTKALLKELTLSSLVEFLFITVVLLVGSRLFWQFSLRHYTSASS